MAFRFRLEKVLKHRRRVVDQRSRAVAAATAAVAVLEDEIAACRTAQRRAGEIAASAFAVVPRQRCAAWTARLEARIGELEVRRREAAAALAERRDELHEAWREREVLEQLRLRHEAAWRLAADRRERREMDEIGQQRAWPGRRNQAAGAPEHLAAETGMETGKAREPQG